MSKAHQRAQKAEAARLKSLPRCPAIWKLTERKSPIHGEARGIYLQVAIPNMAGRGFKGEPKPSFEGTYKLESDVLVLKPKDQTRALHQWGLKYVLKAA